MPARCCYLHYCSSPPVFVYIVWALVEVPRLCLSGVFGFVLIDVFIGFWYSGPVACSPADGSLFAIGPIGVGFMATVVYFASEAVFLGEEGFRKSYHVARMLFLLGDPLVNTAERPVFPANLFYCVLLQMFVRRFGISLFGCS